MPPGRAVPDLGEAAGLLDELARGGALRAQRALVDRRARVALDVDELAAARVDDLAAADRAVGADRLGDLQARDAGAGPLRAACDTARGAHAPVQDATQAGEAAHGGEGPGAAVLGHQGGIPGAGRRQPPEVLPATRSGD